MIAQSRMRKVLALLLACSAHGALALALMPDGPPIEIEGSDGAAEARLGSSFADMAAGTLSAETPEEPTEVEPVEEAALTPVEPVEPTPAEPVETVQPEPAPPVTPQQAEPVPEAPLTAEAPLPVPDAPAEDAIVALAPPEETAEVEPPEELTPPPPEETLEAEEDETPEPPTNALASSARPVERPENLAKTEPEPEPRPEPQRQTRTTQTQPERRQPQAAPQGNAERNANAGQEAGSETATATRSGAGGRSQQAGNAAASNYPGQVMRKLSRVPRPSMNVRGATVVAFRIGTNGGLAGASVARSSGSSALDSAALRVVQRAAPFPAPPAGAQRSFSVQIKAR